MRVWFSPYDKGSPVARRDPGREKEKGGILAGHYLPGYKNSFSSQLKELRREKSSSYQTFLIITISSLFRLEID